MSRARVIRHSLGQVAAAALIAGVLLFLGTTATRAETDAPRLLRLPFVSQFDGSTFAPTNCGPASLTMIWRYFYEERPVPDQVRRALARLPGAGYAANPDSGTGIQDLARLARLRGMSTLMGQGISSTGWTPLRIAQQVRQDHPVIVLTRLNRLPGWTGGPESFDHWIVVTGVADSRFVYHDSGMTAGANRVISSNQLAIAMAASTVPGQGAAFVGGGRGLRPASAVTAGMAAVPAMPTPVAIGRELIRIGNGSLAAKTPGAITAAPEPTQDLTAFGNSRFIAV